MLGHGLERIKVQPFVEGAFDEGLHLYALKAMAEHCSLLVESEAVLAAWGALPVEVAA